MQLDILSGLACAATQDRLRMPPDAAL